MTKSATQTPKTGPAARGAAGEALRLDNQLCFALYAASGLVTRAYRPLLEPLGLTYPQYLVMMALWERAPRTVKELGQALDLDSGTLTPLLKRLETAGFVVRRRDSVDERRVQIELTEAGHALRDRAAEVPAALACQLHLPLDEIVGLRATLQDLARKLR
ncbi:MarR family winged helix-turn-helix transcriptional regulator [Phenylobacterium sp.]|uniref:MarR family winged helix-turn-helix transcriptional regulator n=1 Tax=Phenylobacterium sp. TaxID=1871053 RepID=UPI002FC5A6C3